jgi:hypothetical protein
MKKYQRGLMTATLALGAYAAIPAHAEVLNIPASAAIYTGSPGSECGTYVGIGIATSSICDFEIPLTVPVGHTIQQVSVVHGTDNNIFLPPPVISASLSTLDFATPFVGGQFSWSSFDYLPNGVFQVTRLMAQTKFGAYPNAFLVQPNTMYEVVLHIEGTAFATGLQVTYQ